MQTFVLSDVLKTYAGVPPAAQAAGTFTGTGVQRSYQNEEFQAALLVADVGATTGAPTSFTVTANIQDSADNVTFADYTQPAWEAGASVVLSAAGVAQLAVDLRGARAYIRAKLVVAFVGGTAPTVLCDATLVLGRSRVRPAASY